MPSARRCAECDATGVPLYKWDLNVCADNNRRRVFHLCTTHDIAMNRRILTLLGDPKLDQKMAAYEAKRA